MRFSLTAERAALLGGGCFRPAHGPARPTGVRMWKLHVMVPETKTPWPLEHAYSVRQDEYGRMWAIVEGNGTAEDIDAMVRTLSEAFGYGKDWTRFALEASQDWFRANTKDLMRRPMNTGFKLSGSGVQ